MLQPLFSGVKNQEVNCVFRRLKDVGVYVFTVALLLSGRKVELFFLFSSTLTFYHLKEA